MNPRMLMATTARVLNQLRHDERSIAMILIVPSVLLAVVYWLFENETLPPGVPHTFNRIGPIMLAIFPFVIMFLITSITMLRERTSGTLERLMTTPIHKADLLFGYGIAFALMAALQSVVATGVAYWVFNLDIKGYGGLVVLVAVVNAVLGVSLGLFCSAFARTEFQAVQFMPVVVIPQILLCGLFVARDRMNDVFHAISDWMPLTYSVKALQEITANTDPTAEMWRDLWIMAAILFGLLVLASLTLRRKSS
ncbi:ABC transporter permease [Sinomonas sp. JGH33]|uniref:Transport permease protein n=1 Tax=Sinomonas terricola TaxID=3110330 RepID=A0ABU5T4K8_9MICC|nr:ABC transporter permease [Sinomonas sp. JGH33]MEA5454597.1 ABC transporter permease [Sinomonas sp. JGH33]